MPYRHICILILVKLQLDSRVSTTYPIHV